MEGQPGNRIFSLNGNNYKLKKIDLGVLNKAAPLLLKFRRLQYEYTKDIDDTELRNVQREIEDLKTAIAQLQTDEVRETDEISRLKKKLESTESEFKNNSRLQQTQQLLNDAGSIALFELLTDKDTTIPFLKNVLEPEGNNASEMRIEGPDALEFIKETVTHFFVFTLRSNGKFQS